MKNFLNNSKLLTSLFICILLACLMASCRHRKSDEEQILEVLNGYLKAHAKGEFEKSYKYLAPQTQAEVSERDWIITQMRTINSTRLMRDPLLKNIVIRGDSATAEFHYRGISPESMTKVMISIYSKNVSAPVADMNNIGEEYMIAHFNEMSEPQIMALTFIRTPKGWSMLLDARGRPRAL